MKFKTKPIPIREVDALRYTDSNFDEWASFVGSGYYRDGNGETLFIETPDGRLLVARHGDWIIKDERDYISTCNPSMFENMYKDPKEFKNTVPTEAGFYWATTIKRNKSKRLPEGGQIGGLRWIVRLIDYSDIDDENRPMKVQTFGSTSELTDLCDHTDWDGPLGDLQYIKTKTRRKKIK